MDDDGYVRDIYVASYHRLVGQLYAICGDRASAEEVVQEAFVRALTHHRSFRAADNPQAWLRTVALNLQRNRWRQFGVTRRLASRVDHPTDEPDLTPDHVALVDALRGLPADQREAIVLHHVVDLPVAEVAETLRVPEGTVKARLARGRAALGRLLAPENEDEHA